jgi:ribosomal protein S18 acetylase RimI-like enzyme
MIRLLAPEDFALWKALRLEALAAHPPAYNGSFEEESVKSDGVWISELQTNRVFFYMVDGQSAGMAGYYASGQKKKSHQGIVFTVYVRPEFRGRGIMDWLLQALAYHARDHGVEQLHLGVDVHGDAAIRCYERNGFAIYATEPRALKLDGEYIDEYLMVKYL